MELKKLNYNFSVCKVADFSEVDLSQEFCFIGKTDEGAITSSRGGGVS